MDGIAFFKESLFGEGGIDEGPTPNLEAPKRKRDAFPLKLYKAIDLAASGTAHGIYSAVEVQPATKQQVHELARWYAGAMVERFWEFPTLLAAHTDTICKTKVLLFWGVMIVDFHVQVVGVL